MPRILSPRLTRALSLATIPAALVASAVVVSQASYAAYSSTTSNPTSNWATGNVHLTDDDSDTALFNVTNMKPGATGTKCIQVTSDGSLASSVKLYGSGLTTTNGLSSAITLTITQGTGATFGSCTGFTADATGQIYNNTLANFSATGFGNGIGTWTPSGASSETKSYKFTYTLASNAGDGTQGGTASIGFTWEAQNT